MESRERIKNERKEGKSISEMVQEQKGALSAGKAFNAGLCEIGKTVFDIVNSNTTNTRRLAKERGDEARLLHASKVAKANEIKELGKSPDKLTIHQLKTLLAPLKRTGDKGVPSRKSELLLKLIEWEARGALSMEEEVALVDTEVRFEFQQDDKNYDDDEVMNNVDV